MFTIQAFHRRASADTVVLTVQGDCTTFAVMVQNGGGAFGTEEPVLEMDGVEDAPYNLDLTPGPDGLWRVDIEVPMDGQHLRTAFVVPRHYLSGHTGEPVWNGTNGMPDRTVILNLGI